MKTLVLAEKPSVGRDIARVINKTTTAKTNGFIEGPQYIVTWALGHLVALADPEEYDKSYKNWDINHLPIMPNELRLTVIPGTSKQYKTVKDLLHRKDVSNIIIATDAGREGELVARWIIEKANVKKPIKRLWISSVTDKAIKEGFANLKDGKQYISLSDSAKARAEADWLVGINATRCLTTKFNSPLSCGRVQTPTLAIIAKREEEIRKFIPQPYYGLTANATFTWADKNNNSRSFDKEKIEKIYAQLKNEENAIITDVSVSIKKKLPPKLYDLTELQRDANKRYGYSPKETLSIMQKLYEEHKVLTYPRTDSRYISSDIVSTLTERIKACCVPPYNKICAPILKTPIKANSNFVDDSKVSDHHAIIPTEQPVNLRDLNEKERKIYDLVITRFISIFYPPFEYEQVNIKAKIGNEQFTTNGRVILSQGYKAVNSHDDDEDDNSETLPPLKKGQTLQIKSIKITEGKTSPPTPFNEATLLSAMESPTKYMDNKTLADTLQKTGGLGTVATRADIIEKLYDNFVIEKKGKDLFTTSKGRQLLTLVPSELKSPELTGEWEQKLQAISTGKLNKTDFLKNIRLYTKELILNIKNSEAVFRHDNLSTTKCPECGLLMLAVTGKKGEMLVCQDRECNTRVNISMQIRSKCPNCHKFLKITGAGDKKKVECTCGHSEKYETFEKRKKETMSKKDVAAYLAKSNKKEAINNPFGMLKDLKFEK